MAFYERITDWKPNLTPTMIEITRPCMISGQRREVGEVMSVSYQDALQVADLKRCKIIVPDDLPAL